MHLLITENQSWHNFFYSWDMSVTLAYPNEGALPIYNSYNSNPTKIGQSLLVRFEGYAYQEIKFDKYKL